MSSPNQLKLNVKELVLTLSQEVAAAVVVEVEMEVSSEIAMFRFI